MDYEPDFALVTDNNEVLTSLRPEKEEKDEYFEEKPDVVISLNSSKPSATSQEMHNVSFSNFKPITYNAISILYLAETLLKTVILTTVFLLMMISILISLPIWHYIIIHQSHLKWNYKKTDNVN